MGANCWEVKACGRCVDGVKKGGTELCPACTEAKLDGVHGGKAAGRACWVVAGTFCGGQVQGTFGKKFGNCEICEFYQLVKREEAGKFQLSISLLSKLK